MFVSVFPGQCRQGTLKVIQEQNQPLHENKSDCSQKNPIPHTRQAAEDDIRCAGGHEHIDGCVEELNPKKYPLRVHWG